MHQGRPANVSLCVSLFAIFLLGGCERKGVDTTETRVQPDPRVVKNFAVSAPWFCAIPTEHSEGSGVSSKIVNGLIVGTGEDKKSTYESLTKSCTAAAAAPKGQCSAILKSGTEKCVGASTFNTAPPTTGLWRCDMTFHVDDLEEKIETVGHTTANSAIAAAFKLCAELKDAEIAENGAGTTRRDACAKAMIAPKMTCKDLNAAAPIPTPAEAQRRLTRKPRK